jgi:hypothetical protein
MSVSSAFFSEGGEGAHVQPMIASRIELDRVTIDEQKRAASLSFCSRRRWRIGVVNGLSQVIELLPQASACFLSRTVGPQQASQGLSTMSTVGLDAQVGQQGLGLARGEVSDRLAVQGHSERAHEP